MPCPYLPAAMALKPGSHAGAWQQGATAGHGGEGEGQARNPVAVVPDPAAIVTGILCRCRFILHCTFLETEEGREAQPCAFEGEHYRPFTYHHLPTTHHYHHHMHTCTTCHRYHHTPVPIVVVHCGGGGTDPTVPPTCNLDIGGEDPQTCCG